MLQNVMNNSGWSTSIGGILIVFAGLVLIACCIIAFNAVFAFLESDKTDRESDDGKHEKSELEVVETASMVDIPEDHQAVIGVLIELYRRVHFDPVQSDITFLRGNDAQNAWRLGFKYGQRRNV